MTLSTIVATKAGKKIFENMQQFIYKRILHMEKIKNYFKEHKKFVWLDNHSNLSIVACVINLL